MLIAGVTFPDVKYPDCPAYCDYKDTPFSMTSPCFRCPILNCTGEVVLLPPHDFNPLIALKYRDMLTEMEGGDKP